MNYYAQILRSISFPDATIPSKDIPRMEQCTTVANYYEAKGRLLNPLYRWRTKKISKDDFLDFTIEYDKWIKYLCEFERWELVNVSNYQETRYETDQHRERILDSEGNYLKYIRYTSVLTLKRKMDRDEFLKFLLSISENNQSGVIDLEWAKKIEEEDPDLSREYDQL
ncbi:hypothetical protein ACE5IS_19410 [Leptospira wolffii]|uniref:DUF1564 family protein n=1 Tax=Leptospira wolffii TaxID=409998 RepID=A0ABV5BTR7_9LEPT